MGLVHDDIEQGGRFVKKSIGLSCFLMVAIIIFSGCNTEKFILGEFTPSGEDGPKSEYFQGGTYINEYFGFTATFPKEKSRISKNELENTHGIAASFEDGASLVIRVFNTENRDETKGKPEEEIAEMYFKAIRKNIQNKEIAKNVGGYLNLNIQFLGQERNVLAVKSAPMVEGLEDGIGFYLPLTNGNIHMAIIGEIIGAHTEEDIQKFLDNIFTERS